MDTSLQFYNSSRSTFYYQFICYNNNSTCTASQFTWSVW